MARGFLIGENYRDRIDRTIARVDGMADGSSVTQIPTRIQAMSSPATKVFRICTFTGSWSIDTDKTVTFRGVTSTPNTVTARNIFANLAQTGTLNCAIAKDGTAWYLIAAQC